MVPFAAIQAVPIAVIAWYRLHRYAWYRYSAIVNKKPIVHYCYGDWTVGIIKDGLSLGGGRAKHFCDILRVGNIIYINEKKAKYILDLLSQYQKNES